MQSWCLVCSWNEAEILLFGLVCMTWQVWSFWVCKAHRELLEERCRAERQPGTFSSIFPAGRYSQSRTDKTKHFDFSFKGPTWYFPKIAWEWINVCAIWRISESRTRVWVRWWCRHIPAQVSVCKLEWFSGDREVWENTGELHIQMLWLHFQHWEHQPSLRDPEHQLVIPLWKKNTPPDLGFLYEGRRQNNFTWVNSEVKI